MDLQLPKTDLPPLAEPARPMIDTAPPQVSREQQHQMSAARNEADAKKQAEWSRVNRLTHKNRLRVVCEGAGIFFAVHFWFFGPAPIQLSLALVFGALVGLIWLVAKAETLLSPLITMPAYAALQVAFFAVGLGDLRGLIWGTFFAGTASAVAGTLRSMRAGGV
jgi:hypothetical protein